MGKCDPNFKTGMQGGNNPYLDFPLLGDDRVGVNDRVSSDKIIGVSGEVVDRFVTHDMVLNYQNDIMSKYDTKELLRACDGFTRLLQGINVSEYPSIVNRVNKGIPISVGEISEYIDWSNRSVSGTIQYIDILLETELGYNYDSVRETYVPIMVTDNEISSGVGMGDLLPDELMINRGIDITVDQRHNATTLIKDYNTFLSGSLSNDLVGAFCSIFANPYKLLSKIDDIRNFKVPSMKEIVDGIKSRVASIIDKIVDTVKRKFDNLKEQIADYSTMFQRRMGGIEESLSVDNVNKVKTSLKDKINNAFNNFKEVTPDVLAFLMFRFCKLSSGVEFDLMAGIKSVEQLKKTYDAQKYGVIAASERRSQQYMANGAVRYSSKSRADMRNSVANEYNYTNMSSIDNLVERVIQKESGGNPNAVNKRTGASGLMQIMEHTARNPGFSVTPMDWNKRFDPAENRRFGTEYLQAMIKHFNGDQVRALVAYNWGVGNAQKWDGNIDNLNPETKNYVNTIMGQMTSITPSTFIAQEITEEERKWVNSITRNGDAAFKFDSTVLNMGSVSTADWNRYKHPHYNAGDNYPDAGWKHIVVNNPSIYIMLRRVHKRLGVQFNINSAYRSKYYNDMLRRRGEKAALESPHTKAQALDVSTRNMSTSQVVEFIKACSQEGFKRISVYDTFIHIDIGSSGGRGDWTRNYRGNPQIREAMMLHIQDKFRRG